MFSQRWEIFRVATHEKGGLDIAAGMSTIYSTKQLFDMLEHLDVYDSLAKQEAEKNKPKNSK